MEAVRTVSIEAGMPTASQAVKRMTYEIHLAKSQKVKALKIIHGYGSSGRGGRIRIEARDYLMSLMRRGVIRGFVPGESFSIFDEDTRTAFSFCTELRSDKDLERHNNGVTIIIL